MTLLNMTKWQAFKHDMIRHYSHYWLHWLFAFFCIATFQHFYILGINVTESLPYHVFLIKKYDKNVKPGEIVSFTWEGGGGYPAGLTFVKVARGLGGDRVSMDADRNFYVNNQWVGRAKEYSRKHEKLEAGKVGVIPPGYMYVQASHLDSLDSRYAITGWIPLSRVQGTAVFAY